MTKYNIMKYAETGKVYQPHVYELAAFLGKRYGCTHIIDIGCGNVEKLVKFKDEFTLIGIDNGSNIDYCRQKYEFGNWIEADLEQEVHLNLEENILERAVVICADAIEHLQNPKSFLNLLYHIMDHAPVALISTPERDKVRGINDFSSRLNPYHIGEWHLDELVWLFKNYNLRVEFSGLTINNDLDCEKKSSLLILSNNSTPHITPAPDDFRVVAIMNAYNEADIIAASIKRLIKQNIDVYLIDNWSTDGTAEIAGQFLGKGLIGIEKFPPEGRGEFHNWHQLLKNVEDVVRRTEADWFIHHDIDELRQSPWRDVSLRHALYHVQRLGFNSVDFTLVDFHPVDNSFVPGNDFVDHFSYWDFGKRPGHFIQIKAWRKITDEIIFAQQAGHRVSFDGQRIFPYKFLTRHYRVRSEEHARRKLYQDRKPSEDGKARGWHTHYDALKKETVLKSPEDLELWDVETFCEEYLVERLSGIGILD